MSERLVRADGAPGPPEREITVTVVNLSARKVWLAQLGMMFPLARPDRGREVLYMTEDFKGKGKPLEPGQPDSWSAISTVGPDLSDGRFGGYVVLSTGEVFYTEYQELTPPDELGPVHQAE